MSGNSLYARINDMIDIKFADRPRTVHLQKADRTHIVVYIEGVGVKRVPKTDLVRKLKHVKECAIA